MMLTPLVPMEQSVEISLLKQLTEDSESSVLGQNVQQHVEEELSPDLELVTVLPQQMVVLTVKGMLCRLELVMRTHVLSTEDSESSVLGQNVQQNVKEELSPDLELVTVLPQQMVVLTVKGMLCRLELVTKAHAQ